MNTASASTTIVTSLAVSGALVLIRDSHDNHVPTARLVVGLTFTGVGLGVLAQYVPNLAGGTALLILTTSVFVYGGPALAAIARTTKPTP